MIPCQLCSKQLRAINFTHLRAHGLTVADYREKFPDAPLKCPDLVALNKEQLGRHTASPEWRAAHSERMKGSNNPFHGKKHDPKTREVMSREQKRMRKEGITKTSDGFLAYARDKRNRNASENPFAEGGCAKTDRQKSLRRYGHACMICGWEEIVHNHHIFGISVSRELRHMVILCPNHHALADLGKITADELLALTAKHE